MSRWLHGEKLNQRSVGKDNDIEECADNPARDRSAAFLKALRVALGTFTEGEVAV